MQKSTDSQREIDTLAAAIARHDELYWKKNRIEISDAEYDQLRQRLKLLAPDHPTLQQTGEELKKNEETVQHAVPMLSIEKVFTSGEVANWAAEAGAFSGANKHDGLVATYKIDGSSCSLIYENGLLLQAATRGNGREGNLITRNALQVEGLPHSLKGSPAFLKGRFEVRGEIYCSRPAFDAAIEHFERLLAEGAAKADERPPNARNFCSGSIMLKDPREVAQRKLSFMAHGCVGKIPGADGVSELSNFKALEALHFQTPFFKHISNPEQIAECVAAIDAARDGLPYDTDGVVFIVNRLALHDELGATSHHPRYKIAFKYQREQGQTTVRDIRWNTSRSGRVCPTLWVEPIHLGGATVELCTAHNAKHVLEIGVAPGDTVLLEREVIPYLVKKISGPEKRADILPSVCPSCGATLFWDDTKTNLMCPNLGGCKSQLLDYLCNYVSKHAADLDGIGEGLIGKMLDAGLLKSPADFYTLTEEKLLAHKQQLEPMGERLAQKIVANIGQAREQNLAVFLVSLGIKGLGRSVSAKLAQNFSTLENILRAQQAEFLKIDGIAETLADGIARGLKDRADLIAQLTRHVVLKEVQKIEGTLSGKSFCLTGHVEFDFEGRHFDARGDIEALIASKGGAIKSVSKKLDYLVAGEGGGSKSEKAQKAGVKVVDASALVKLLNDGV